MPQQQPTATTTSPRLEILPPEFRALTVTAWREHAIDVLRVDHMPLAADLLATWPATIDALALPDPRGEGVARVIYHPSAPIAAVRREIDRAIAEGWAS